MLPLRIELAMTFKAVFLNFWPSANPDIVSKGPNRAVSGCNILILPVDASVLPPHQEECLRAVTALFCGTYQRLRPVSSTALALWSAKSTGIENCPAFVSKTQRQPLIQGNGLSSPCESNERVSTI